MKKRILFLTNIPTPYQIDFFSGLDTYMDVKVIFTSKTETNRDWNLKKYCWMHFLNNSDPWEELKKILEKFNPTHIVIGGYKLPLSFRTVNYSKKNKVNVSYWLEPPLPSGFIKKMFKIFLWCVTLTRVDQIFAIDSRAEALYSKFNKHVYRLPYSINALNYPEKECYCKFEKQPVKFLFVGQFIDRKGIKPLLEAASRLDSRFANLTLVGSGELSPLINEYSNRFSHINISNFVEPSSLPAVISKYDILVAPSVHDGWCVVIPESMLLGLPIISTITTGAFNDLVKGNSLKGGLECFPTSESIYQCMMSYINSPDSIKLESDNVRHIASNSLAIQQNAVPYFLDLLNSKVS